MGMPGNEPQSQQKHDQPKELHKNGWQPAGQSFGPDQEKTPIPTGCSGRFTTTCGILTWSETIFGTMWWSIWRTLRLCWWQTRRDS